MKKIILSVFIVSVLLCAIGLAQAQPSSRTLVVYFSATGTTKAVAQEAADLLGADLYDVLPQFRTELLKFFDSEAFDVGGRVYLV